MVALGFLDVEAHLLDPLGDIEIEHVARRGHAGRGQHRDHVERHRVPAQQPDAGDRPVKGAAARPGHSVAVVQLPGAVDADPEIDLGLGEEIAPGVVDQGAIGLKRMDDRQIPRPQTVRSSRTHRGRTRSAAPSARRHAIPPTARPRTQPEANTWENKLCKCLRRDHRLGIPVRQIAVLAIDIAKRGRLDDQQVDRRHGGARQRRGGCSPAYQLRHQLFQLFQLRQLFQLGQPQPPHGRTPVAPPIAPGKPQSRRRRLCAPARPATVETASRMAASRSDTRA